MNSLEKGNLFLLHPLRPIKANPRLLYSDDATLRVCIISLACYKGPIRVVNFFERKVSNVAKAGGRKAKEGATFANPSVSKRGTKMAAEATSSPKKAAAADVSENSTANRPEVNSPVAEPTSAKGPTADQHTPAPSLQEDVSELDGVKLPAARGKAGTFGGPKDRSAKPDDKLALPTGLHFQYERYRSLNANHFYCAMRWDYRQNHMSAEEGKRWFANKKILVTNPRNGLAVVVRAVDYGPHEKTGLIISISPGAAEALGLTADDEVNCAFADQKARPGPVE